ncbi:hypothetical protein DICPUDRAFT_153849 [Dictyostelium purpureum]|uniref:Uncharacterized protein n=1 Tax=Dictyostelium purpureum TaxID=5786 RepID=F0ZPW6_DICPU|nr:uncharacterized protein DICPUDRAFT_153849 [Dictyostelium purpureum]EGC34015.1 hypothetical protein DICPUDRAFT_153849 [Dictyostelium purpureum]|eukprot:XP_003289459.1 hypothetical protein DICPUDRAFT_153849 [Dictyostelium purpureum]
MISLKNLRIERVNSFYINILAPNLKECSIVQCQKFKFPIELKQNQIYSSIEAPEIEEFNFRNSLSAFPSLNSNLERLYQIYPNLIKIDLSFAKFKNLEINFQHPFLKIFIAKQVDLYKITFDGESKLEILNVRGSSLSGGIGIKHPSFFKSLRVLKKDSHVHLDSSYIGTYYPGLMAIGSGALSSYFIKDLTTKISILGYTSQVDSFSFKGDFFGLFDIGITKNNQENDRFPLIANRSSTLLFIIDTSNSLLTDLENIFIHCNKYYKEKIEELLYLGGIKPLLLVLCDDKEFDGTTLKDTQLLDRIEVFKLKYKIEAQTIIYHFNKSQIDDSLISMESVEKEIISDDFKSQLFKIVKENHRLIQSNKSQSVLTISFSLGKISDTIQYVNLQKSLSTNELLLNVCSKYNINPKNFIFTYSKVGSPTPQKRIDLENTTIEGLMLVLSGSLKQIYLERKSFKLK